MIDMDLQYTDNETGASFSLNEILSVLKDVNSVCEPCKGKGEVYSEEKYGLQPCSCCGGKGYHKFKELLYSNYVPKETRVTS